MEINIENKPIEDTYTKLFAKQLLAHWLQSQDKTQDACCLGPFHWRSNYGVFVDLPFHKSDEPYYFEASAGLMDFEGQRPENKLEWFKPGFNRGRLLFTPDITIFHKGSASILIYIEDDKQMSVTEMGNIETFFEGHHVELYAVSAKEVLSKHAPATQISASQIF